MADANTNNQAQQSQQGTQGEQGNQNSQSTQFQQGQQSNQSGQAEGSKQYTQEQINSMMANEKRTARQALLKELGFDVTDDKNYAETLAGIKKTLDAGKTQQQLDQEAKKTAEAKQHEAEAKAATLELKVAALGAGVKADCLDDVIVLAQAKVSDSMPITKVLEEFKTKYPTFFGTTASSGTGNPNNPARGKTGTQGDGLGKRLAQSNKPNTKSSYFKN